jgi:hypothetical protein
MNARAFDHLIGRWRAVSATLPDRRTGDTSRYTMADIALAAFAVVFTQCPSFLSFQQNMEQSRGRNYARTLFQVGRIPSDNHIRQTPDPVEPRHRLSLFDDLHQAFEEAGLLQAMRAVNDPRLIALDATGYFSSQSQNIHCPNCSCLRHTEGTTTHCPSAITPVIVSPGHKQVVPLRPEFIVPQDGQAKQDCEINAAKRGLAAHGTRYSTGNDTLLGDDLYALPPFCRQGLLHAFHFLFTCKPASHGHLSSRVEGLQANGRLHALKLKLKGQSNRWEHHCSRWANGVPLTDSDDALKVTGCEVTITHTEGAVLYRNAFITDWQISTDTVAGWWPPDARVGRSGNENNNVLKPCGYHLEHNFGHGKAHRASLLLTMNLLAFGLHTLRELSDESYRLIRMTVGARRKFFQHLEALTTCLYFETWERRMDSMMRALVIGPDAVQKS